MWVKCFVDGSGGFEAYAGRAPGVRAGRSRPADLNGDGRDDFFLYNPANGVWVEAFSQAGFGDVRLPGAGTMGSELADHPGGSEWRWADGSVPAERGGVQVSALSREGGSFDYVGGRQWAPGWSVAAGDLNGDGTADLFLYHAATGMWSEALSDGAGISLRVGPVGSRGGRAPL